MGVADCPPGGMTLGLMGDLHHGLMSNFRRTKLADTLLRTDSPLIPKPVRWVQIGDLVDDPTTDPQQDIDATAWVARFSNLTVMMGNHDIQGRTQAAHEALYGSAAQNVDCGQFRLVTMSYLAAGAELTTAAAMISSDTRPVVLGFHFPPRDTVLLTAAPYNTLGSATPYTYALQSSVDAWLRLRIADKPNLKFVVHGHVHAWKHAVALNTTITNGGRTVGSLNVGATSYMGSIGSNNDFAVPIYVYLLTMITATTWEIRCFEAGGGTWQAIDPSTGSKTTTVTTS